MTRRGKTKFENVEWYNLCLQIIQTQTCYPQILPKIFNKFALLCASSVKHFYVQKHEDTIYNKHY